MAAQQKPLTGKERIADMRARRAMEGLIEIRGLFLHPDDHAELKALAKRLNHMRQKKGGEWKPATRVPHKEPVIRVPLKGAK
jgi:hypothetical protein